MQSASAYGAIKAGTWGQGWTGAVYWVRRGPIGTILTHLRRVPLSPGSLKSCCTFRKKSAAFDLEILEHIIKKSPLLFVSEGRFSCQAMK